MIKYGLVLKWVIVILLGLGGATAMAYYANPGYSIFQYPKSIYEYFWKKPKAPEIVDQYVEGGCGARVHWVDNALDEDGVRFYRRVVGQPNFVAIQITGAHAGIPGSFDDDSQDNLPVGTYEYRVSVFNEYGQRFSNISGPVVIVNAICGDGPLLIGPLNPIITDYQVVKECDVQIGFDDHSLDEDGLRVYRSSWVDNEALIAELGPHAGVPGEYMDQDLPPGQYMYQISVFNANGEAFSNVTDDIEISALTCSNFTAQVLELPIVTATSIATATSTPVAAKEPQACIWKAAVNVFIRKGPGASIYPELTAVESGILIPVVGQSEDGMFWALEIQPGVIGYVSKAEKFGLVSGDCNRAPTLQDPAPPPSPVPTKEPAGTPQCSDGIDNDGDRLTDMRDGGCSNLNDNSE